MLFLNRGRSSTLGRSRSERVLQRLQDTCDEGEGRRRKVSLEGVESQGSLLSSPAQETHQKGQLLP